MSFTAATRTGMVTLIARLLGGGIPVQWRTTPQQMIAGPSAVLDVISEGAIGVDEITMTPGPTAEAPTELTPTVYGLRETTIQVTVWSASQQLEESARASIQLLRTRLQWPSADEELRAMGLAIVDIGETIPLDLAQGSRLRSSCALEMRLGFGVAEADAPIPLIEHVHITSIATDPGDPTIKNTGGTTLPASVQANDWIPALPPEP